MPVVDEVNVDELKEVYSIPHDANHNSVETHENIVTSSSTTIAQSRITNFPSLKANSVDLNVDDAIWSITLPDAQI